MTVRLLDASAVLAWLRQEPGSEIVDPLLATAKITASNWAEVLQKVIQAGRDVEEVAGLITALGLEVVPVLAADAPVIAGWWRAAPALSLGDRTCLAVGQRLGAGVVTADRRWSDLEGVEVVTIR